MEIKGQLIPSMSDATNSRSSSLTVPSCFHGTLDTMLQERAWLSKSKEQVLTAKSKFSIKNLTELTLLSTHMQNKDHFDKWDGPIQKIPPKIP